MTELWSFWLEAIRAVLQLLSSDVGLGMGSSIIVTTLLLRTALLPISWTCAYRNRVRQKKLARLKPELERLKATYAKVPQVHMERVMALYRAHGLAAVDGGAGRLDEVQQIGVVVVRVLQRLLG
jgi:membrane protein insertase Oxa1/YidC/SpoIIIJ